MKPLAILASGMVTAVGLSAPASCAAIRAGINNFSETRFIDSSGEWIVASQVPLDQPWRGIPKLVNMVVPAIKECMAHIRNVDTGQIPLLLCVAEKTRPGRFERIEQNLFNEVQDMLGVHFHKNSGVILRGRVGGVSAIKYADMFVRQAGHPLCIIAGVDTFLTAATLNAYEKKDRILTSKNSNGFIPGEAGAAVLLCPISKAPERRLAINGIGFGNEEAHIDSGKPLRAEGLVQAFKGALSVSGLSMGDLDYRITDANGEQYKFKEGELAITRTLRTHKGEFDIWHPAECIGEVGAATVFCVLGVAEAAAMKRYSRRNYILCHFGNDNGDRAAIILSASGNGGR